MTRHFHRGFFFGLLLLFPASTLVALSLAPPPIPPLGWENRITPGFDPPVEEIVVLRALQELRGEEPLADAWQAWGAGAIEVLAKLLEDERWKGFEYTIVEIIMSSPFDETRAWARERLDEIGVAPLEPDKLPPYFGSLLGNFASKYPDEAASLRDLYLERGNAYCRYWAVHRLLGDRSEAALAQAEQLATTLPEERGYRASILKQIAQTRGHVRAQQPMHTKNPALPEEEEAP